MEQKNRAVLYLRLSKEDVNKLNEGDDSASIKNQRLLLTDYALEKGFNIVNVYSDDDESGLYDDRPGFERMILGAKLGEFDVIIAKTQSRFSRNMEHIEKYLHRILPNLGIRFIGAVDGTDTANKYNKVTRQMNGIMNELYCEDLSRNIRSAFKAKMRAGQFLGSSCPYGYKRDPENHNHLLIDDYAAAIVRKIFMLYLQGNGKAKIGSILTKEGVLIPTLYKKELGISYSNAKLLSTTKTWSYQTIHTILNNQTYIGNLVQNRANALSYKDKKRKSLPKDEWIIVEGTHEAIIDKETFQRVQELQKRKTRSVKADKPSGIFSGMIFCADCKHAMSRSYARHGDRQFQGYVCRTYKTAGKQFCSSHLIKNDALESAVLFSIKEEAKKILQKSDMDELEKIDFINENKKQFQEQLKNIEKQIEKNKSFKKNTYQNLMEEIIQKDDYVEYIAEYDKKISELEAQKDIVVEQMEQQEDIDKQYDEWVEAFKDYINIKTLTREVVMELINKIEVNEDGSINIYYRFQNPYE